jgi:hypothetical protein
MELPSEVEAGLLAQAQAKRLSLDAYTAQLLRCAATPPRPVPGTRSLVDLFAPLRGFNLEFGRNPSAGRPADL